MHAILDTGDNGLDSLSGLGHPPLVSSKVDRGRAYAVQRLVGLSALGVSDARTV